MWCSGFLLCEFMRKFVAEVPMSISITYVLESVYALSFNGKSPNFLITKDRAATSAHADRISTPRRGLRYTVWRGSGLFIS